MEGLRGADAGGRRGHGQFRGTRIKGPSAVVAIGTGQGRGDIHVSHFVFEGLKEGDGTTKGVASHGVFLGHVQSGLGAADLLKGIQHRRAIADGGVLVPALLDASE